MQKQLDTIMMEAMTALQKSGLTKQFHAVVQYCQPTAAMDNHPTEYKHHPQTAGNEAFRLCLCVNALQSAMNKKPEIADKLESLRTIYEPELHAARQRSREYSKKDVDENCTLVDVDETSIPVDYPYSIQQPPGIINEIHLKNPLDFSHKAGK